MKYINELRLFPYLLLHRMVHDMFITDLILTLIPLIFIILFVGLMAINEAKSLHNRSIAFMLSSVGLIVSFLTLNILLSQPRPSYIEFIHRDTTEVEVVSAIIINRKAIYMWMLFPHQKEPRYYVFDWDQKLAERLQRAMRERDGRRGQGKIMLKRPFSNHFMNTAPEKELRFIPNPNKLPPKTEIK